MRLPEHVDYIEPTPEEREANTWRRCTQCELDWPLRFLRLATQRCLNCARAAERESQTRSRARRAGREVPLRATLAVAPNPVRAPERISIDDVRSEFGTSVSAETEAAIDELLGDFVSRRAAFPSLVPTTSASCSRCGSTLREQGADGTCRWGCGGDD
jgi:hypothetical protein